MIKTENLCHTYMEGTPFQQEVLFDIHLEILERQMVCIIGPTRSGKSTLIQYFNALYVPKRGKVWVSGMDTSRRDLDLRLIRRTVGLVFQYPEHQLFADTVGEDIAFGLKNLGIPRDEMDGRIQAALETVGLDYKTFRNRYIIALSGGQKRRVALASVIALGPKVLILDDPTAGLDPRGRREILSIIRDLHRDGMTVIMVSHNMEDVAAMAQRVVVMKAGRIALDGPPGDIFSKVEELKAMSLGIPQVTEVLWALRSGGYPVETRILDPGLAVREIERAVPKTG
ncbi:MAG: energy-coupling factor transporter ATPase [Bacillota bacterium]